MMTFAQKQRLREAKIYAECWRNFVWIRELEREAEINECLSEERRHRKRANELFRERTERKRC